MATFASRTGRGIFLLLPVENRRTSDWHNFRPGRTMSGKTRLIQSRRSVALLAIALTAFKECRERRI